jgi:hypothetical protein
LGIETFGGNRITAFQAIQTLQGWGIDLIDFPQDSGNRLTAAHERDMSGAEHDKGFEGSGFAEVGGVGQECMVAELHTTAIHSHSSLNTISYHI